MKVKFRFNKRSNVMVTLIASGAALAMMVVRFGYPADKLFEALWVAVLLLAALVGAAAVLGLCLRWLMGRGDSVMDESLLRLNNKLEEDSEK
ncbi:hypothetical protein [Teredinibacter turnerae]|uniref:hypothetical protein n=1 Tax=Teredinibacter turnerae TaxID=2426 RepID=UPI000378ED47|nr:hypothetical protein [Teredinibacter turnerae]